MDHAPSLIDAGDRRDLSLLRQAVVEWDIPPEALAGMGKILWDIVDSPRDDRVRVAASRVLVGMAKVNSDMRKNTVAGPTVNVNILSPESLRSLSMDDLDRRIQELEAESGGHPGQ